MSKITVTAAEGVRAKVTVFKRKVLTRTIPELKDGMGNVVAPQKVEEYPSMEPQSVVTFASEAREFDIGPDDSVLVEEQQ